MAERLSIREVGRETFREEIRMVWGGVLAAGTLEEKNGVQKLTALPENIRRELLAMADMVLTEADGSRHHPIKAPAAHEPVIPAEADAVLGCMGLSAIGRPAGEVFFRREILGISPEETVTEELAADVLSSEWGGKERDRQPPVPGGVKPVRRQQAAGWRPPYRPPAGGERHPRGRPVLGAAGVEILEVSGKRREMKVLIKGAGDLATGIACRLHNCGFQVAMTEIEEPTTVRRTVAFSRAVWEGQAEVEQITGLLCRNEEEIRKAVDKGCIGVIVDRECRILRQWKPDVFVDAVIAKVNTGTALGDAPTVIGVGPGFTAGKDCHCVVETKRGHDLGRCIWQGSAAPDTGVPGIIGGYGKERLIKTEAAGRFYGSAAIADRVRRGQTVGYVETEKGRVPVTAQIDGVLRGILQDGVTVKKGMKAGDVDPRDVENNCFTVSDKARAVGGGVLEAILAVEKSRGRQL